jgi:hypothetical protein
LRRDASALAEIRQLRARLKKAPARGAIEKLDSEAAALEGASGFRRRRGESEALSRLNERLASLLELMQEADAAPTAAMAAALDGLEKSLERGLSAWSEIRKRAAAEVPEAAR